MSTLDFVRAQFALAPDRDASIRTNPITGGRFTGDDDLKEQNRRALLASAAQLHFAAVNPQICQHLPLTDDDIKRLKNGSPLDLLVSLYAFSFRSGGYKISVHPSFARYASGVLALPDLRNSSYWQVLVHAKGYPPRALRGLTPSLVYVKGRP